MTEKIEKIEKIEKTIKRLKKQVKSGESDKAFKIVEKFLKNYPDNLEFILIKSEILLNLEKYDELDEFLNSYNEDIYKSLEIVKIRIKVFQHYMAVDEIAKFVNKSLIYYPDDNRLMNINIDTIGDYVDEVCEEDLQEMLKVNPNNFETYLSLATIYSDSKNPLKNEKAIEYFDKAIELQKSSSYHTDEPTWTYIDKGQSLMNIKKYEEALKTFDLIPDDDMNSDIKIREKAIIYRELEEYDKALEFINKAIKKDYDDDPYLKEIKGTIYLCMKDYNQAIYYFNRIINKYDGSANYYMAQALKGKGEYKKAIDFLNKIKENEYLKEKNKTDYQYKKAQKLIKEINGLI